MKYMKLRHTHSDRNRLIPLPLIGSNALNLPLLQRTKKPPGPIEPGGSAAYGAGDGNRTRDIKLGKLAFYH